MHNLVFTTCFKWIVIMKRVTTKIKYLNWVGLFIIFIGIRSCAVDQKYAEYKTTALNRFTLSKNDTLYRFYAIKPEKDLKVNNSEYYLPSGPSQALLHKTDIKCHSYLV